MNNPGDQIGLKNNDDKITPPSYEEALKILQRMPDIPGTIRNALGGQNIKELMSLLYSNESIEADALSLCGHLPENACIQYVNLLPEYVELEGKLNQLVLKIVDSLRPKIPAIIEASKRNEKKGTIQDLYNDINKLGRLIDNKDAGYRNLLYSRFRIYLYGYLFSAIGDAISEADKPMFIGWLQYLDQLWHQAHQGLDFAGTQFIREKEFYHHSLVNYESALFHDGIFPPQKISQQQMQDLEQQLALDFEEIKSLAEYRKILFTPHNLAKTQIAFMGDDFIEESESYSGICHFQVSMNPAEKLEKPSIDFHDGLKAFDYGIRPGVLNLNLNRSTGELTFTTNHAVPFSAVMIKEGYLPFKKKLFDLLLDYLRKKEPDVKDLFIQPKTISGQTAETGRQVTEVLGQQASQQEDKESEVISFLSFFDPGLLRRPEPKPLPKTPETTQPDEEFEKQRRNELVKKLRNLNSKQLSLILERLMGKPERTQGSHHFFRSPKNRVIIPVPIHASHPVKFPLLRDCLKKWDILREFILELGI